MVGRSPRGQVLVIYIAIVILSLAFITVIWDTGTIVSWQVRAQRSADAAAQAEISVQAQEINRMEMLVYAGGIEEARIRQLLYGVQLAAASNGSCALTNTCASDFLALKKQLNRSVARYTDLVEVLDSATHRESFANMQSDAWTLLDRMTTRKACGTDRGLDCSFGYAYRDTDGGVLSVDTSVPAGMTMLNMWEGDSCGLPGQTTPCGNFLETSLVPNDAAPDLLGNARAEVTVCHLLKLPIAVPGFSTLRVTARSAYRLGLTHYENSHPGDMDKPGGGAYLPAESYTSPVPPGSYDWYNPTWQENIFGKTDSAVYIGPTQANFWISWFGAVQVTPTQPPVPAASLKQCV